MRKIVSTKQLRGLRLNVKAAAVLTRMVTPHLVRQLIESLELGERVRRSRMSSRERRIRRSLKLGAYGVGVAAVGAVAARRVGHDTQLGTDRPELDRL
jgi:hypothetical protein